MCKLSRKIKHSHKLINYQVIDSYSEESFQRNIYEIFVEKKNSSGFVQIYKKRVSSTKKVKDLTQNVFKIQ